MGVTIAVTRGALNTTTGTQDFTTSDCGGLTPVAALFILTHAQTDGSEINNAVLGIGAATGASERWTYGTHSANTAADADTGRHGMTDKCIVKIYPAGTMDGEADFDSFITNGVRIDITDAFNNAFLLHVVLFCGSDVSAYAGTFNPHATQDNSVGITAPGFTPDAALFFSDAYDFDDTLQDELYDSHGVAVNDGSETQRCNFHHSENATAKQECHAYFSENRIGGHLASGGGSFAYTLELTSFDVNGFTVYTRDGSGDSSHDIAYLALNFNNKIDVAAGTYTIPGSTGDDSLTGLSFKPQAVLMSMTALEATASHESNYEAGSYGFGLWTANAQYCAARQEEDASATMDTQSTSEDQAIWLEEDDGTDGWTGTLSSLNPDGFTINLSVAAHGPAYWWYLALQEQQIDVSDTITVTENVDLEVISVGPSTLEVNVSDGVTVTDTPTAQLPDPLLISESETVTVAENVEAKGSTLLIGVSDSVTVGENIEPDFTRRIGVSDSVEVTESVAAELSVLLINVSDSIGVSESRDVEITRTINVSDSVTVTESVSAVASKLLISVSDTVTVTESIEARLSTLAISVSDSITVTESRAVEATRTINVSDAITVTESVAVDEFLVHVSVSDTVTITESVVAELSVLTLSVSDTVTVAEDVQISLPAGPPQEITESETINVTENVELQITRGLSVQDTVTVTESVAAELSTLKINVSDSISVTDTPKTTLVLLIGEQETIGVSESVEAEISTAQIVVSDTIAVTENIHPVLVLLIGVSDTVTLSESADARLSDLAVDVQDSIGVSEFVDVDVQPAETRLINVSDTVTITESVEAELSVLQVTVSDTITVLENVGVELPGYGILGVDVSDTVTVTESVAVALSTLTINVSDSIGVTENIDAEVRGPTLFISVSDTVAVTESLVPVIVTLINVSDSIGVSDSPVVAMMRALSVSDTVTVTDSAQLEMRRQLGVSDTVGVSESVDTAISTPGAVVSDVVTVTENVNVTVRAVTWYINVVETINVSDSVGADIPIPVKASDTITLQEMINVLMGVDAEVDVDLVDALVTNLALSDVLVSDTSLADASRS